MAVIEVKRTIKVKSNDVWVEWKEGSNRATFGDGVNLMSFMKASLGDVQRVVEQLNGWLESHEERA